MSFLFVAVLMAMIASVKRCFQAIKRGNYKDGLLWLFLTLVLLVVAMVIKLLQQETKLNLLQSL